MSRGECVRGDQGGRAGGGRQYQKRKQAKACRKEGKQSLEDAPPRNRYRGWST